MTKKNKGILIAILAILILLVSGCIAQLLDPTINGVTRYDSWGSAYVESSFSLNPIAILRGVCSKYGFMCVGFLSILAVIIWYFKKLTDEEYANRDERNFTQSTNGSYGTSGMMTKARMKEVFDLSSSVTEAEGTILGVDEDSGKIICPKIKGSKLNKHVAVFGASGTGKSTCFVINQIMQCAKRGESVIVTDPKGELYANTSQWLREQGYEVRIFDLVDPKYSDSWNCLDEIGSDPDKVEIMAQTFADVVIKNTGGNESKDPFWDTAEMNLLKALCLYVALDENRDHSQKTIGAVYEMLTNNDEKKLNVMFDRLRNGHPAKAPWAIYKQAGDNVRGNVIIGLGARMQVFQSAVIKSITAHTEIDLEAPATRKCAYYVIMSDQDSTLDFLSSLFFSFLFIRLVRYADIKGPDGKCNVPVNFILDEFPNIGQIPDFTKKLSTIRSRDLRVCIIFQNLAQLQNRYPNGLWEEIVGNCDTQLFLGCTDEMTAKFISTRSGEMTIEVRSVALQKQSIALTQSNPTYRETQSVGKRFVFTPDEVLRLDNNYVIIIMRGEKLLKAKKFFCYERTDKAWKDLDSKKSNVRSYIPQWRAESESKKFDMQKEAEEERNEEISNKLYDDTKERDIGAMEPEKKMDIEREVVAKIAKPKKDGKLYSSATKTDVTDDF